jgi:hypothetical protein
VVSAGVVVGVCAGNRSRAVAAGAHTAPRISSAATATILVRIAPVCPGCGGPPGIGPH